MNILITGATRPQSFKTLKAFEGDRVVMADYGDVPSFPSAKYSFISLGERNDDILAYNLLNACLDNDIDHLMPLYNFEIKAVAKAAVLFSEFNIEVLLPDIAVLSKYNRVYNPVTEHYVVYIKGKVLYSSEPWAPKQEDILSGAFYIRQENEEVITNLLTVY